MIDFLLGVTILLSIAIMVWIAACWFAGFQYDQWVEEFNKEGIKTALEPVLMGSDVVGYTVVMERRARAR